MDTKQLVDKFINGEITEAEFDAETSKLTPEQKTVLEEEAKKRTPDAVEKLKGVRRGIDQISQKKENENVNLAVKLKQENLEAALNKFFNDFAIEKEEDRKSFREGFKTESISVDSIVKDLKTHYVAQNPDRFLSLEKEKKNREKEAEELNAQNAGANGSNGGGKDNTKATKEVKDFMEASRKMGRVITQEQAERALKISAQRGHISTQ